MRRFLSLFACVVAIGGSALAGVSAHADDGDTDVAYCPPGSVNGSGNWTPPQSTVMSPHQIDWETVAQCIGSGDETGPYVIDFTGTSTENCVAGSGGGSLNGTGPEGPIFGTFTFNRGGIHLYISGTFTSGGEEHMLQYWLDVKTIDNVCTYSNAPLIGHGVIADWTTGPPPVI